MGQAVPLGTTCGFNQPLADHLTRLSGFHARLMAFGFTHIIDFI